MLYCKRHDLAFCGEHIGQCLGSEPCYYAENPDAKFCAVCSGLLLPTPPKKLYPKMAILAGPQRWQPVGRVEEDGTYLVQHGPQGWFAQRLDEAEAGAPAQPDDPDDITGYA